MNEFEELNEGHFIEFNFLHDYKNSHNPGPYVGLLRDVNTTQFGLSFLLLVPQISPYSVNYTEHQLDIYRMYYDEKERVRWVLIYGV